MSTNMTFTVRCTSKTLQADPANPGSEKTFAQMTVDPGTTGTMTGNVGLIYDSADDTLQVSNYYNVTMVDGTAPAKRHTPK